MGPHEPKHGILISPACLEYELRSKTPPVFTRLRGAAMTSPLLRAQVKTNHSSPEFGHVTFVRWVVTGDYLSLDKNRKMATPWNAILLVEPHRKYCKKKCWVDFPFKIYFGQHILKTNTCYWGGGASARTCPLGFIFVLVFLASLRIFETEDGEEIRFWERTWKRRRKMYNVFESMKLFMRKKKKWL